MSSFVCVECGREKPEEERCELYDVAICESCNQWNLDMDEEYG